METNMQHYLSDILALYLSGDSRCAFIRKNILKNSTCDFVACTQCVDMVKEWLDQPYEEPKIEIDWSKVPVDTPVYVWFGRRTEKCKRYFAKYEDGWVYTFDNGCTSWTSDNEMTGWDNFELAREEDVEKYQKQEQL